MLFGDWKIDFYIGYNLESHRVLSRSADDSSLYVLNITLISEFENVDIRKADIRIILPEGSTDIDIHLPFSLESPAEHGLHATYLDTEGRPTILLRKTNLVPEHSEYFQITYRFKATSLLHEIFLLIGAYLAFFIAAIVYVRFELSISEEPVKQTKGGVNGAIVEQTQELYHHLAHAQAAYDQALESYLKKKDKGAYNNEKKKLDKAIHHFQAEFSKIEAQAKSPLLEELRNLLKKAEKKIEQQHHYHETEINFHIREKNKDKYAQEHQAQVALSQRIEAEVQELLEDIERSL